jgi:ribose transport system ATP-binding protein
MLVAKNISKNFGSVKVLHEINLDVLPGRVHAIIGENGAGKSTLMKILSGVYLDYEGSISINGNDVKFSSTKDAEVHGVSIIHQELNLIPGMSIAENMFLGSEIMTRIGWLDKKAMNSKADDLLKKLKLTYGHDTLIKDLKVGEQQLVEIAKALLANSNIIIMDEPTSAISGAEVDLLFEIIEDLKKENKAVLYISHKLDELYRIADDYSVLRDGQLIHSGLMKDSKKAEIISQMVGRKIDLSHQHDNYAIDEILLTCKDWTYAHNNFSFAQKLNFSLKKGEIVGLFGLMGSGRTELLQSLFGLRGHSGELFLNGQHQKIKTPEDAIKMGLALVSEDRKKEGIFPILSVAENLSMNTLVAQKDQWLINKNEETSQLKTYTQSLSIKYHDATQAIEHLSGGNQQKIVLAKCLLTKPLLLLLDEPTRGVDVKAKEEIYTCIRTLAQQGMSILFVSSEIPEVISLANTIWVMAEGQITTTLDASKTNEQEILKHALNLN